MMDNPKEGEFHKTSDSKDYYYFNKHRSIKDKWDRHKQEGHGKLTNTLSIKRGSTKNTDGKSTKTHKLTLERTLSKSSWP